LSFKIPRHSWHFYAPGIFTRLAFLRDTDSAVALDESPFGKLSRCAIATSVVERNNCFELRIQQCLLHIQAPHAASPAIAKLEHLGIAAVLPAR